MRHSQFWELMDAEFSPGYARSIARDQVIGALGGRTAEQALAAGTRPREVWEALCDALDVPPERRLGPDLREPAGGGTSRGARS